MIPLVTASEQGEAQICNLALFTGVRVVICRTAIRTGPCTSLLKSSIIEGENPVDDMDYQYICDAVSKSRVVWECSSKWVVNSI